MRKPLKGLSILLSFLLVFQYIGILNFDFVKQQNVYAQETDVKINFQPQNSEVPQGYLWDNGQVYGNRNGYTYGWNTSHIAQTAEHNTQLDQRLDTVCPMQNGDIWEIELTTGSYDVTISVGDAVYASVYAVNLGVENNTFFKDTSLNANQFVEETQTVEVSDGKLTISQIGSQSRRIGLNYIHIAATPQDVLPPTIPQNLNVQNISSNTLTLSWTASIDDTGVAGYIIYRNGSELTTVLNQNQYNDTGLVAHTGYTYEIAAFDDAGNISGKSQVVTVITATEPGNGIGLEAAYYNGTDFNEYVTTTINEAINFEWSNKVPVQGVNPDAFSVRWEGYVEPRFTEIYTFQTQTHGGVRLWVNDQLLFEDWNAHNNIVKTGTIALQAGKKYKITMEYCQRNGAAIAKMMWSSASQALDIIPSMQLCPPFVPEPPRNINTQSTSTTVTLTWDTVANIDGYDVEVDGKVFDNGLDTTYTQTGLIPNISYTYRIRSKIPGLTSQWSQPVTVTTQIAVPQNVTASIAEDTITISWDIVNEASGYEIEVDGQIVDNEISTTYIHSGLMPNTQHTYRVRAKNHDSTSDWSTLIQKTVYPTVPTNIHAIPTSTTITLAWDTVPEAVGYDVEVDGIVIDNKTATTYIHSGLIPNTLHTYRVRARKADGAGEWSTYISKSTLPQPGNGIGLKAEYYKNPDLTNLKVSRVDETVNFEWKHNAPASGVNADEFSVKWTGQIEPRFSETYTLYTQAHGGVRLWIDGQLLIDDWGAHNMAYNSATIMLEAGQRYDIRMEYNQTNGVARVGLWWESSSQDKEVIPRSQLYPIGRPRNITASAAQTAITVKWGAVAFATGYEIEADGEIIHVGTATSYTHTGLMPGTLHNYRVRAISTIVTGDWSAAISKATLLGKPESIQFDKATETTITLFWDDVYGATGYEVEVDGNIIDNAKSLQYIHQELQPGTIHSYRARAKTAAVTGEWTKKYTKWTLPDIPQNICATSGSHTITLTWDEVIGATDYEIEIYGDNTQIETGNSTEYVHTGLNPNTQKAYRVRAKNESGVGKWSSIFAATTLPAIPNNIKSQATDTTITLTWDAVSGASGYDIEVDGTIIDNGQNMSYQHQGLIPNTQHRYRVRAKSVQGTSDWSQEIIITTLPSIPQNLRAIVSDTSIIVSWDEVFGVSGYDIEVDGNIIDNGISTTYKHTDLMPNTTHTYRVRAKNGDIKGQWTDEIQRITLIGIPENIRTVADSSHITITWDTVIGALGYDIEVDGTIIDNGISTTYKHTDLMSNTAHTYRVRARNAGGIGEWSYTVYATTLLGVPQNITVEATSTTITLNWDEIPGASSYDVMVDGVVLDNGIRTTYQHIDLEPNTLHIYRIRARIAGEVGVWSQPIKKATLIGIPSNIRAEATSTQITVMWDEVEGATGYEIEVDGVAIDNGSLTTYIHEGLMPNTLHTYRVRAKNESGVSEWSGTSDWSTLLPQITAPEIPQNLRATATINEITLMWDEVENVLAYDIEVDGEIIENVRTTRYVHAGLEPNTRHMYRVRAKNEGGTSEWSEKLEQNTMPELAVNVGKDNIFNFVIVAPEKEGVSTRTITVYYNPEELEVLDLCAITPEMETTAGMINGTDITVTYVKAGEIKYTVHNADKTVVNSIKLMAKVNGHSKVRYVIE